RARVLRVPLSRAAQHTALRHAHRARFVIETCNDLVVGVSCLFAGLCGCFRQYPVSELIEIPLWVAIRHSAAPARDPPYPKVDFYPRERHARFLALWWILAISFIVGRMS